MPSLCPTSSELLALDDDDLVFLHRNDIKRPLPREIAINLKYSGYFEILPEDSLGTLAISRWQPGTTSLCGSCSFCLLLNQGVHRSLNTRFWPWKEIAARSQHEQRILVEVAVHLDYFAYIKDTSPWADGQESLKTWNVHSVFLSGHYNLQFPLDWVAIAAFLENTLAHKLVELEFEIFANQDNSIAQFLNIHRSPLDASPLSDINISNIRRWIDNCDRGHQWCSATTEPLGFLPTRLVEVGNPNTGIEPRLILTDALLEDQTYGVDTSRYIALSYCWGSLEESSRLLKTTHSTMQERLNSINFNTLPLALKDAVTVARTLEVQYLWIDSLCIIQDDLEDWQIESSRMADIFSNAYVTIVAATGASCHDSFLYREPNQLTCDIQVHSETFGLEDGQFSLRSRRPRGTEKMSEIVDSRWITRGWTFQEERLARRVLMFGKNKFFLDCRTIERAEDTENYRLRPDWVGSVCGIPLEENGAIRASKYSQMRSSSDHWQTLCGHYSYRKLTFPADKLPAISGIASKFSEKLGGDYLAGLWKDYLLHDLFWYCVYPATRPEKYRAPSWSWASVDLKISYPFWRTCGSNECEMYCTILDAQVTTHGLDPFGAVDDGFLKIRGRLLQMETRQIPERKASLPQWSLHYQDIEIAQATPDTEKLEVGESRNYWALLFAKCKGSEKGKARKSQPRGLLLQKCEANREGLDVFQRVGVFYISQTYSENYVSAVDLWRKAADEHTILII
ncbi:heterokaryon incompatibility protein-domain-containing protein [Cadophora sp. MPI-SDFR-AT-0126]|nr:heterokaryon incompatibility protein-domain-containing protein [Leotiomycetes sp. MPI-SDFR-AT-0126]